MTGDRGAHFGKFRGTVANNEDPLRRGRIRALVPTVFGPETTGWALPCSPAGFFAIPAVGAGVWIEFEQGDADLPIWTGCWWDSAAEMQPGLLPDPQRVLLQTSGGHSILLDDTPGTGGITLHNHDGQTIALTGAGIELGNGKGAAVALQGPTVSLNGGALEVT